MVPTIWYIHGAGATENSFTWLRSQLTPHTDRYLSHSILDRTADSVQRLQSALDAEPEPVILIGHSLGGVIARACASRTTKVSQIITLCAPFGGIQHAALLSLFSTSPLFRDLSSYSDLLLQVRRAPLAVQHLAIVASKGLPIMLEPNDGVVTLGSQMAIRGLEYFRVDLNHFEVLLSPQIAGLINSFIATGQ